MPGHKLQSLGGIWAAPPPFAYQYGQLRALLAHDWVDLRKRFVRILHEDILSGAFARQWSDVQARGRERLEHLRAAALTSPLAQAEADILKQARR